MPDYAPDTQYPIYNSVGAAIQYEWDPYPQYERASEVLQRIDARIPVVTMPLTDTAWNNGDLFATSASHVEFPAMGTIKTLGAPSNAWETEYDAVNSFPVVGDDGTITCATDFPVPTSSSASTASVNANAVLRLENESKWTDRNLMLGAADTNRSVFTSAVANEVGFVDLGYAIPSIPAGGYVYTVAVTPSAFASGDTVMPYTIELVDKYGQHIGSAAQAANAGGTFTFTGIKNTDLTGLAVRIKGTHNNSTTSATLNIDSCSLVVNYKTNVDIHYRSEVIYTSDLLDGSNDYTNFRYVEGDRIRLAFDVLAINMKAQDSGAYNCIFQSLGKAVSNNFPFAPVSIQVLNNQWRVQHGQGVDVGFTKPYRDGVWVRWEIDMLLGRAGTGTVKVWKDGEYLGTWTPTAGTFYAGTGDNTQNLQWVYLKNGLYGAATTWPQGLPKTVFRNRRLTVTHSGVTSTWLGPQVDNGGIRIFRRNPVSGLPY